MAFLLLQNGTDRLLLQDGDRLLLQEPAATGTPFVRYFVKCESDFTNSVDTPNGTSIGAPTFGAGQVGNAATFDGVDDGAYLFPANTANGWEVPGAFTCTGLAWDAAESCFWIGDYTNSAVKSVDATGLLIATRSVGFRPQGVAVDADGLHLWVSDYTGQAVKKILKADGSTVSTISLGWSPNGVTINGSDNLLIVRDGTNTIYEYTKAGSSVGTVSVTDGGTSVITLGYQGPDGIHWVDSSTCYLVIDGNLGTVGDILAIFNPSTGAISSKAGILDSPEGVTIKDGELWISVDDEFHRSIPRGNRVEKWSMSRPSFSFGGWFKSSSMASTVAMLVNGCPLNNNPPSGIQSDRRGAGLYGLSGATSVRLLLNDGTGASTAVSKDVSVTLSSWKHITCVVDGANQEARVYVDGVVQGTALSLTGVDMTKLRHKIRWGLANSPDGDVSRFANLQADEVFFAETTLTTDQIDLLMLGTYTQEASGIVIPIFYHHYSMQGVC